RHVERSAPAEGSLLAVGERDQLAAGQDPFPDLSSQLRFALGAEQVGPGSEGAVVQDFLADLDARDVLFELRLVVGAPREPEKLRGRMAAGGLPGVLILCLPGG